MDVYEFRGQLFRVYKPGDFLIKGETLARHTLKKLSADPRSWHFEVGDLSLSAKTRDAYFSLQDELVPEHLERAQRLREQAYAKK